MLGKNSKTMRNFEKGRHFFAKMQNTNSVFFAKFSHFLRNILKRNFAKNFIYSRNRFKRIFVFLASERNTKICENVHENFFIAKLSQTDFFLFVASPIKTSERIFSFLQPVPSKRVRGWVFQTRG